MGTELWVRRFTREVESLEATSEYRVEQESKPANFSNNFV